MGSLKSLANKTAVAMAAAAEAATTMKPGDRTPPRAPVSNAGAQMLMGEKVVAAENRAKDAEAKLGKPLGVPVDRLVLVDARRRVLSAEDFSLLKANIQENGILEPIRVRPLSDGRFEVTSGSNRATIGIELGLEVVPCVIVADTDDDVERKAFYSNLFHAPLPDFEKYLGFAAEMKRAGLSQAEMSRRSGVPKATLAEIMSFDKLPAELLGAVEARRHDVSRYTVAAMLEVLEAGAAPGALLAQLATAEGVITPAMITAHKPKKAVVSDVTRLRFSGHKGAKIEFVAQGNSVRVMGLKGEDGLWMSQLLSDALRARFGEPKAD